MELNSIQSKYIPPVTCRREKCGICKTNITHGATIYQEEDKIVVVCELCYKANSPEDLGLMANLFQIYGGYFGKLRGEEYSLYDSITKFYKEKKSKMDVNRLDIRLLHQALLHGITPNHYKQSLKILAD